MPPGPSRSRNTCGYAHEKRGLPHPCAARGAPDGLPHALPCPPRVALPRSCACPARPRTSISRLQRGGVDPVGPFVGAMETLAPPRGRHRVRSPQRPPSSLSV